MQLKNFGVPWQIDHIIKDIRLLLPNFNNVTIQHIIREGNKAADKIANFGYLSPVLFDIVIDPNSQLCSPRGRTEPNSLDLMFFFLLTFFF